MDFLVKYEKGIRNNNLVSRHKSIHLTISFMQFVKKHAPKLLKITKSTEALLLGPLSLLLSALYVLQRHMNARWSFFWFQA